MPRLEVLVGMIGSSKSTYARERADEGAIRVSHDDLTEMLHGRYRYEQGLRETYRRMEELIANEAIVAGRDVVIDRTHLTRESRARWVGMIARMRDYSETCLSPAFPRGERTLFVVAVEFPREPAVVHARRRYEHDHRGRHFDEWFRVALHHERQAEAEPLADDEGFDEIIRIGGDA